MSKAGSRQRNRWKVVVAFAAACALLIAVALLLVLRFGDTRVVLAVPRGELAVYQAVLQELAGRGNPPAVRLQAYDAPPAALLQGRRPGLAIVPLAPWVLDAIRDGRLDALPADALGAAQPRIPRALAEVLRAGDVSAASAGRLAGLPIACDPWVAAWHRDFIGGANAAPPRDWGSLEAAVKAWGRGGVAALALPGREPDALVAWLAMLAAAGGPAAAAEAFTTFPLRGRETMAAAIGRLARLEAGGLVQKAAFSYPWQDAVGLVLQKKAAGILIPLGRYRGIDPVASAPFVTAGVPAFAGEGSVVVAEVRVLVMPRRGARGRGAERVVAFLAEPGPQRAVAEALHMVPARLDAPVRDGASFEAAAALRDAAVILPAPGLGLKDRDAAAVAAAAVSVLRSPAGAADAVAALYGAR